MERKGQISKATKTLIPGPRKREVKEANEELEFKPDCQVLKVPLKGMSGKILSERGSLEGDMYWGIT